MSKLIQCKKALERFNERTDKADSVYENSNILIEELYKILDVEPAQPPVIDRKEWMSA